MTAAGIVISKPATTHICQKEICCMCLLYKLSSKITLYCANSAHSIGACAF
jgi:hypothetical protein